MSSSTHVGRHGRGRPGASGPADRVRCPETIIGRRQRGCSPATRRASPAFRITDGYHGLGDRTGSGVAGMEDRSLGRGRVGVPVAGLGTWRRLGGRRGRGPAPRAGRRRDRGRHPAVRRLPRCTEKPGGCSPAHWMAGVTRWSSPARSGPRRRTAVAQKIQTPLIDDIDGSAAEGTVPVRAGRHRL